MSRSEEPSRYEYLAHRWKRRTITPEEEVELMAWLNQDSDEALEVPGSYAGSAEQLKEDIYSAIHGKLKGKKRTTRWLAPVAAAAAVTGLILAVWLGSAPTRPPSGAGHVALAGDVAPGGNMATLTLGNGRQIQLSSRQSGLVVNASSLSYNDGSAVEGPGTNSPSESLVATTPRGGNYQVMLPDGSKVWLNAASSLKFPTTFNGLPERKVELTGEAYFDIAKVRKTGGKDEMLPFIVISNGQEVEVLGTQFNISGYPDEPHIKTTLVEGSVKINGGKGRPVLLAPGQQAVWTDGAVTVRQAVVEEAVAWKNGYFMFNDEPLESIMHKLSRWYNIDPVFEEDLSQHTFFGMVSKSKPISAVLRIMESTGGVHFRIEGQRVIITR
jgi:ferric-dicitrate binding protein FerR (iron transport regulator)